MATKLVKQIPNIRNRKNAQNLDKQLVRARQQFGCGQGRTIRHETQEFDYSPDLLVLCTIGGDVLDGVHFNKCFFNGMPLDGKENFFVKLLEAASSGNAYHKMVPRIVFDFNERMPFPSGPNGYGGSLKTDQIRGKYIVTSTCKNQGLKFNLTMECVIEAEQYFFYKFVLCRAGLRYKVKRGWHQLKCLFGHHSSNKFMKLLQQQDAKEVQTDVIQKCELALEEKETIQPEEQITEEDTVTGQAEETISQGASTSTLDIDGNLGPSSSQNQPPVPMPRLLARAPTSTELRDPNCERCVAGQYECFKHIRFVKRPPNV